MESPTKPSQTNNNKSPVKFSNEAREDSFKQ